MPDFQLFRIKAYPAQQGDLFATGKDPSEIVRETILSLPSVELRKGLVWHIGNVTLLDETGLYFRIGRTSKLTIEIYKDGNFIDQPFETAPYTHVILDTRLEVCAIARKTKLSQRTVGIANQLVRLLRESDKGRELKAEFEIGEITDPEDFITHLKNAITVTKFWVTFARPNPLDANKDFYEPMQKLLSESAGNKGKTELEGQNLRPDSLEELTRTAASIGNDAGASLQLQPGQLVRKRLRGNPVTVSQEDLSDDHQKRTLLALLRETYQKIRGQSGTS